MLATQGKEKWSVKAGFAIAHDIFRVQELVRV
jgi:hypothetical protein